MDPVIYQWPIVIFWGELSNVPIVLNTSFNENEPIVMNVNNAIECFLRTKMDILVLNSFIIKR